MDPRESQTLRYMNAVEGNKRFVLIGLGPVIIRIDKVVVTDVCERNNRQLQETTAYIILS